MAKEGAGKGGCLIWILVAAALIYGLYFISSRVTEEQSQASVSDLETPSKATMYYIRKVNKVKQANPGDLGVDELLGAVTKSDKEWYYKNADKIYELSQGGFNKMIGHVAPSAMERNYMAIQSIIGYSPNRDDSVITSEKINSQGDRAVVELDQTTIYGTTHYVVKLLKEKDRWKVYGFCGAREDLEKRISG